jgi:hypothetical protein
MLIFLQMMVSVWRLSRRLYWFFLPVGHTHWTCDLITRAIRTLLRTRHICSVEHLAEFLRDNLLRDRKSKSPGVETVRVSATRFRYCPHATPRNRTFSTSRWLFGP